MADEMVRTSIYIKETLRDRLVYAVDQAGVSYVLSQLAEKWLNGEIEISVKPRKVAKGKPMTRQGG